MYGNNIAAVPLSYVVRYSGESITFQSVTVSVTRATIDLPAVNSDIDFRVSGKNIFGEGRPSNSLIDEISELTTYVHTNVPYTSVCTYICMLLTWVQTVCT